MALLNVVDWLEARVDFEIKGYKDIAENLDLSCPVVEDKERLEVMARLLTRVQELQLAINILLDYKAEGKAE